MGTDSNWGGEPATDWHPVQGSGYTPELLHGRNIRISTVYVVH